HVNTMRYIEMRRDMLPLERLTSEAPVRLDVHFLRECRFGQTLSVGAELRDEGALFEIGSDEGAVAVRAAVEWR
ncbi:MAG: acyl-ACP thioesterase, partial [Alistipes sp.]|nr:acyl-ACP thioesterase [Alistipes sp.]